MTRTSHSLHVSYDYDEARYVVVVFLDQSWDKEQVRSYRLKGKIMK